MEIKRTPLREYFLDYARHVCVDLAAMMMMKLSQRAQAMFPGAPAVRIPAQKLQISEQHGDYEADVVSVAELLFFSLQFVLSIIELH